MANSLTVALSYDNYGRIKTKTTGQMKQTYGYDNASGNLLSRDYRPSGSGSGLTESFSYDNLNRLTGSQVTGSGLMTVTYSPDGNINTKTDAGSYAYDSSRQNAVIAIEGSSVTETHYISSPSGLVAILVKQGPAVQTYYVETDHLGSVTGIINTDKTYASRSSYDAWGRRRNPSDWSYNNIPTPLITDRGFTGHEHLDHFGLINMNGRMYDPVVGRFLGVDPVVQAPEYSQSYNGYSYCWNNPLKYTDPSGYLLDAESWQRAMYESSLRRTGVSQSDIWMLENDSDWETYFDNPYTCSDVARLSYISNYSTLHGKRSGYYVIEYVDNKGKITHPKKLSEMGSLPEYVVRLWFIPISQDGLTASGGGGMPGWASDANTGVNAFLVGNGAKTELLDYAVRTNYKSARKSSQFNKLRPTQQAWRTTNTLGKTGSQYLKYVKGLGYVGAGLTTTYSAVNAGSYYYNGGTDWQVGAKATLDVIMTGVGFLGPIGFGISAIYFVVDVAGGFGDFGEIKP